MVSAALSPGDVHARVILAIAVILVAGRVVGLLFSRLGQPAVIGEIVAGVLLGPSLIGAANSERLFPPETEPFLRVLAELGLILFMFIIGLEVDVGVVRGVGRNAAIISLTSIAIPFTLGVTVLAPILHGEYGVVDGDPVEFTPFALFIGLSICATAFAILARILAERQMFRIPLGMMLVSCAVVDDVVGFSLLAVIVAAAGADDMGGPPLPVKLLALVALVAILHLLVKPLLERLVARPYRRRQSLSTDGLAVLLVGVLVTAFVFQELGLATLIGAFLFGTAVPRRSVGHLVDDVMGRLELAVLLLLPIFFVVTGLSVDVRGLDWSELPILLLLIVVASVGKFVGATGSALAVRIPRRQALAVGVMMNTRGLAELVVLNIGREIGVLDSRLFTMLVLTTLTTTVVAGPLLSVVYPDRWLQRDIAAAERAERGDRDEWHALVVIDEPGADADLVDDATALSGGRRPARITLVHFAAVQPALTSDLTLTTMATTFAEVHDLRRRAEASGIDVTVVARPSDAPSDDIAERVRATAPDVVLMRWPRGASAAERSARVDFIVEQTDVDLVLVAGPARRPGPVLVETLPGQSVLVELAARVAITAGCDVVVVPGSGRRGAKAADDAVTQLRTTGVSATPAVDGHGDGVLAIALDAARNDAGLLVTGLDDRGRVDDAHAAAAAGARSPLWLVRAGDFDHPPVSVRLEGLAVTVQPNEVSPA